VATTRGVLEPTPRKYLACTGSVAQNRAADALLSAQLRSLYANIAGKISAVVLAGFHGAKQG